MIGDKLVIKDSHRKAAGQIAAALSSKIAASEKMFAITIAGESGCGKSETAQALADELAARNIKSLILQQDDYFVLPPKSNDARRRIDINWVGMQEVDLDLLAKHIEQAVSGAADIVKPLVIYQDDRIAEDSVSLGGVEVVIAEGTYTTTLKSIDARIFIDLTYRETKKSRLERAREQQDDFLEQVLKIEHEIISAHKQEANLIVQPNFDVIADF